MTPHRFGLIVCMSVFIYTGTVLAQFTDSLKQSFRTKPGLDFKLDSRNAFVANRRANIWGVKVGLLYDNRISIGLGYNFLNSDVLHNEWVIYQDRAIETTFKLRLRYISMYADYIYYKKNKWQLSVPVQIGLGKSFYTYSLFQREYATNGGFVFLYEPCLSAQYRFVKFMSLGAEMGMRLALFKNKETLDQLTAPIYVFRLNVYWGEMINYFWPDNKIPKVILDNI